MNYQNQLMVNKQKKTHLRREPDLFPIAQQEYQHQKHHHQVHLPHPEQLQLQARRVPNPPAHPTVKVHAPLLEGQQATSRIIS
jgi:hypothetical protein